MKRRQFLSAMGLASGSLFLPSLLPRVQADDEATPQRLIIMVTQHGTWPEGWKIRPPGLPEDKTWTAELKDMSVEEFSPGLRPLHALRERLAIVDGLAMVSGDADHAGVLRHEIGQVHALSGAMVDLVAGMPQASAPTLDQLIANQLARPDRFRSLELGVGEPPVAVNYRDRLAPLPAELHPRLVFERLFGLSNGGETAGPVLSEQASVLDRVSQRYADLAKQASGEDRQRLENHQQLVREVEQRVSGLLQVSCELPEQPTGRGYDEDFDSFVSMITAAMSCDLLRVTTLHLGDLDGDMIGYPGEDLHDQHAHNIFNNPTSQEVMTAYTARHAEHFARLLRALDQVPDGEGTLLDSTTCLWVSELANGAHGFDQWPVVIGGGKGLRLGQLIHYPSDTPFAGWVWDGKPQSSVGRPHQKLLTTLAQSFGLRDEAGELVSAMPIRELRGIDNAKIDCTGVLKELLA